MIRKILVTGAGGQLGRALNEIGVRALASAEWIFTDVDQLDITDGEAVDRFFERERPDAVVNCAAYTDVNAAEKDRQTAFKVNRDAPENLAKAAAAHDAAMIHVSTDFVFDGCEPHGCEPHGQLLRCAVESTGGGQEQLTMRSRPYTEEDIPAPINVYGESKLAGERAVMESGCRGAVVRTSWLYSPWGKNFVKVILRAAADRPKLPVVNDQFGSPTSALSLARAIVRMLEVWDTEPGRGMELYHFCDSGVVSRAAFADEIVMEGGLDCMVVGVPTEEYDSTGSTTPRRPKYSAMSTAKIARDFGIKTRVWGLPLEEVIDRLKVYWND